MAYDARAVANYILDLAKEDGANVTPMQLLKLVYIAHGWTLAITGQPLIEDEVEAWPFGPVIRRVYDEFKKFGSDPITEKAKILDVADLKLRTATAAFSKDERHILYQVWKAYGPLTAYQLSGLTHREGTPWREVWTKPGERGYNRVIPNDMIREHFLDLARRNAARQRRSQDQ